MQNQATWDMGMDMGWEVSALELVSTLTGSVYESRSTQGLGKRSAEPGYLGYGLAPYGYAIGGISTGVGLHPTGSVYESRSAQGLGKRSADAEPGYYTQNYWPSVVTPYGYST